MIDWIMNEVRDRLRHWAAEYPAPDIVFGVVNREGEVAIERVVGHTHPTVAAQDLVFRIASLTKSFTAAATLVLRDAKAVRLEDTVADLLPFLAEARGWNPQVVQVRDLLTMTAGFCEDNPWADRQGGLDGEDFRRMLIQEVAAVRPPAVRYEYSNLSYAILGLIIEEVAGIPYGQFVGEELLMPLGMSSTTFQPDSATARRLVPGFHRCDGAWLPDDADGVGAFSAMGGLFSSPADICRWMRFLMEDGDAAVALSKRSVREMQRSHVTASLISEPTTMATPPRATATGYGFGVKVDLIAGVGDVCGHSGGYPGYGCQMAWHRGSGTGLVVVANARYHPVWDITRDLVAAAARRTAERSKPVPADLRKMRDAVESLSVEWNRELSGTLFASNVEADTGLTRLRAQFEEVAAEFGPFAESDQPPDVASPTHMTWRRRGQGGEVSLTVSLTPESPPRIQRLIVTPVPDPPSFVLAALDAMVAFLSTGTGTLPDPVGSETRALIRILTADRKSDAVTLGELLESNASSTTYRLMIGDDPLLLTVEFGGGQVCSIEAQWAGSRTDAGHEPPPDS